MKLYKDVISEGWHFTTRHSQLWFLGLFAAFIVGNGGEIDRYLRYTNSLVKDGSILNPDFWTQYSWFIFAQNMGDMLMAGNINIWLFTILFIASAIVVVYMMMVSQGGLIYAAGRDQVSFKQAFTNGARHALQLFFLNLATYLIITVLALLMVVVVVGFDLKSINETRNLLMIIGTLTLIPLVLIVSFVARYAANYIVLESMHLAKAVSAAWKLLMNNLLVTVEMAVVVLVFALVVNLALLLVTFLIIAPYLSTIFVAETSEVIVQLFNGAFIGAITYTIGLLLVGSIFSTWQWTAWTLLFKRLQIEKHHSKLARIFERKN